MKKLHVNLVSVVLVGGLMISFSSVFASNEVPPFVAASDVEKNLPAFVVASDVGRVPLKALFRLYRRFDELYWRRQQGQEISGSEWEGMAEEFEAYARRRLFLSREAEGHFILRTRLIQGECYLFAAIEYFKDGNSKYPGFYEKGIGILERVILTAQDDIDFLPRYSLMLIDGSRMNPSAGYETIGTGYRGGLGDPLLNNIPIHREVTYDIRPYASLVTYRRSTRSHLSGPPRRDPGEWERFIERKEPEKEPYSPIRQIHTSFKAKELLSEFCPWGVEIYFLLKEVGLTKGLDFSILRPFAGAGTPKLSEFPLEGKIPLNIRQDMESIIGDGKTGYVERADRKAYISWDWVQKEPSYTMWYVSPTAYDMKPSDFLSWALRALKLLFSGPLDLIVDETLSYLVELVGKGYGEEGGIYGVSSLLVDGNNYGLESDFFIEGKPFNALKVGKQIAKASFKYLEEKEIQWLYDGIKPEISLMGLTYDGNRIPPIIIRGEVYGYEKVPQYKYRRTRRIVRYYQLNLAAIAYQAVDRKYDLSGNPIVPLYGKHYYLSEEEIIHRLAWPGLPNSPKPLGSREYATDFTPMSQILKITLDEDDFKKWSQPKPGEEEVVIRAELYFPPKEEEPVMSVEIDQPEVVLQLFNRDHMEYMRSKIARTVITSVPTDTTYVSLLEEISLYLPPENSKFLVLTNAYTLKVTRNGEQVKEIPLNLVGRPDKPLTGKLTSPKRGVVELTSQPEKIAKDPFTGYWRVTRGDIIPPGGDFLPGRTVTIERTGEKTIRVSWTEGMGRMITGPYDLQLEGNVAIKRWKGENPGETWVKTWKDVLTIIFEGNRASLKHYYYRRTSPGPACPEMARILGKEFEDICVETVVEWEWEAQLEWESSWK